MPTKTERILSYLPSAFRVLPKPTALFTVADTFGNELLQAENSLAALMLAHWVDQADKGGELIDDLARIASLYGLAPQPEESVEEFREHLKRYVNTFLDGTVTVQGILRVTAEALGLRIADDYSDLDTWWTRADDALVTEAPRGDDAARLLFGVDRADATGHPASAASITGNVDLTGGVDLRGASTLDIRVDSNAPVHVDMAASTGHLSAARLDEIEEAVNKTLGAAVASHDGRHLKLSSPTFGPSSRLEISDAPDSAAKKLLNLLPLSYVGTEESGAEVSGLVDLSSGIDLSEARFLRLLIDGALLAEVDCAGTNPSQTTLSEITQAINDGLGVAVASDDGHFLKLTSQTKGFNSSIAFLAPAAQDARERLLGPVDSFHLGHDPRPAEVFGVRDLTAGVDLSRGSLVRLQIDNQPQYTVDCAGEEPQRTRLSEITAALNAKLGADIASHDGHFIHLTSPTKGPTSSITFELLPSDEDATEIIFGIGPRIFHGEAATRGRLTGTPDLSAGVDLGALRFIQLSIDGGPLVEINFQEDVAHERAASLDEIAAAINNALRLNVASHDDHHLSLASLTTGGSSRITIEPLSKISRRRFVTRAFSTDEAAQAIFGFFTSRTRGEEATQARLVGTQDLSRGVDLRGGRFLRLAIDDAPSVDIDCAGVRPRATLIGEVVKVINEALRASVGQDVASVTPDGKFLSLASPSTGAASRIAFEPPRADDALPGLLGLEPSTFRGQDATGVTFVATVDLSAGVDLSTADRIEIKIDGDRFEIACAGADPSHTTLNEILLAINVAVGDVVAKGVGNHIVLASRKTGKESRIEFAAPSDHDATSLIFGITPPRSYHAEDATPAQAVGLKNLQAGADLNVARILRLAFDGQTVEADCAAHVADDADKSRVPLSQILMAINEAISAVNAPGIATADGAHLIISTITQGSNSKLDLLPHISDDARLKLFGDVPSVTTGSDATPAIITGTADLLTPVNLSEQSVLRLSVDGGPPLHVDVAGFAPETTFLDEIIARINEVFPQTASATEDDRLRLASPTRGEKSSLALLPLRAIELIEYPPVSSTFPPDDKPALTVRHGDRFTLRNDGVAEADLKIELSAPHGTAGPELLNRTSGLRVRLMINVRPGERVKLWQDAGGKLHAIIIATDGTQQPVHASKILIGPIGPQTFVPFRGERELSDGHEDDPATLQLNNPLAEYVVLLQSHKSGGGGGRIHISVVEAELATQSAGSTGGEGQAVRLTGRVRAMGGHHRLVDKAEKELVELRGGRSVTLGEHVDRVVGVYGPLHSTGLTTPLMIVERIAELFDVTLRQGAGAGTVVETYAGVTIGTELETPSEIVTRINVTSPSQLVRAEEVLKAGALLLSRERSQWSYLDCYGARFNSARFNQSRFAGSICFERAVFNVSRFAHAGQPECEATVFASSGPITDPPVEIRFLWSQHLPGAFIVNLPADLPERFGGQFNQLRFANQGDKPEEFKGIVTEPTTDPDYIITRLEQSALVQAKAVPRVPIGFEAVTIPFRRPRHLRGGTDARPARIYLAEKDVDGFIEVSVRKPGAWGNAVKLAARKAGPALFDVTVQYQAARFESARQVALGGAELPSLTDDILRPGPVGILQAKAAGVHVKVSRDRAGDGD